MHFSNRLIQWYLQNKRDLPWRNTSNPYVIWLSEIILQQTRIAQGLPYFEAFLNKFPTVLELALAEEEEVLKLWEGLGYYSRARNLHATAKTIAFDMQGTFPNHFSELKKLKGVGDYTAAAIASFAFKEVVPVVDGNVYRVLSRVFGIKTDILSSRAHQEFFDIAKILIDPKQPDVFNQAIMEFGALYCTPSKPDCNSCIFNTSCIAFAHDKVSDFPVKIKKVKVKKRFLYYLILINKEGKIKMNQRIENSIWKKLYEFDLVESDSELSNEEIVNKFTLNKQVTDYENITPLNDAYIEHKLTHLKLHLKFYIAKTNQISDSFLSIDEAISKPKPIVIHDYILKNLNKIMGFI
jgi:A/G-specific adenine glycosylase